MSKGRALALQEHHIFPDSSYMPLNHTAELVLQMFKGSLGPFHFFKHTEKIIY